MHLIVCSASETCIMGINNNNNREANNNFEDTADNEMEDLLINEEVTDFKEEDFVLTKGMHCTV